MSIRKVFAQVGALGSFAALLISAQVNDGTKFSPLDGINAGNVAKLQPAWISKPGMAISRIEACLRGLIPASQNNADFFWRLSTPAVIAGMVVVGSGIADNGRTDMPNGKRAAMTFVPGNSSGRSIPSPLLAPEQFGGERKGDNRHANSVVALNAKTGKVVWFFQTVHHDRWDYEAAGQPALITAN